MKSESPASPPDPTVYVVALDMSDAATHVLDVACDLGSALGGNAEMHILHVVAQPAQTVSLEMNVAGPPGDYLRVGEALLERTAARAATRFRGRIAGHLGVGDTWREIVQMASDLGADLVVVGTSGRTGLSRFALGSVAEQVVRHAGCPVLVARPKEHQNDTAVRIEPPCPDCLAVRAKTHRASLWCERHTAHHAHGRLHYELPPSFALGSMNFRPET